MTSRRHIPLAVSVGLLLASSLAFPQWSFAKEKKPGPVGHFVPAGEPIAIPGSAEATAEIVAVTPDGLTVIYTSAEDKRIGFLDIADPTQPEHIGQLGLSGKPASVAVTPDGQWAIVVTSKKNLAVVIDLNDISAPVREIALSGQPDSIAISPDGRYAAVAIENKRSDEKTADGLPASPLGAMPQAPAGNLTIIDLNGAPDAWTTREVALTNLATRFPQDPEPEFVDINSANQAVVTLQENNHVVIVDLASGSITSHFSAGQVEQPADLEKGGGIVFDDVLVARREPDGVAWTPRGNIVTANEGDYDVEGELVGGRNLTIFSPTGSIVFDAGASLELAAVAAGLYPDSRSAKGGIEVNGVEVAAFHNHTFLFAAAEKANFVAVYRLNGNESNPKLIQLLPTGTEPEGVLAVPQRNLLITANEGAEDVEDDASISIFIGRPGNPR